MGGEDYDGSCGSGGDRLRLLLCRGRRGWPIGPARPRNRGGRRSRPKTLKNGRGSGRHTSGK